MGYPGISGECPSEVACGHLVYEEGGVVLGVLECLV